MAKAVVQRLKREEKRSVVRREPISETKAKVVEEVETTPGWTAIVAVPHFAFTILALLGLGLWGMSPPSWFIEVFKITMYAWFLSIPAILALPDRYTYETRTEWRRDAYPVSHYGV